MGKAHVQKTDAIEALSGTPRSLMSGSRLSVQMPQEPPIYVRAIVAYWFLKSRFPKHCGFRVGRTTQRPTRRIHEAQSAMACGTIVNLPGNYSERCRGSQRANITL